MEERGEGRAVKPYARQAEESIGMYVCVIFATALLPRRYPNVVI